MVCADIELPPPNPPYPPPTPSTSVCNNDPILCPSYMVCADIELPAVTAVENFTTYYFTGTVLYCTPTTPMT